MTDPRYYDWSTQNAWAEGAWAEGAWLAGAFAPGAWLSTSGGGDLTPPDPVATLDFVAGSYFASGASRTIGDVLGADAEPGTTFSTDDVVAGGLRGLLNGGTSMPSFIGPLLSDILSSGAGVTLVFDFDAPADATSVSSLVGIDLFNSGAWDTDLGFSVTVDTGRMALSVARSDPANGVASYTPIGPDYTAGRHKVAMTVTGSQVAASIDGSAALSVVLPLIDWNVFTKAYIGNGFDADYLRSIKVYAPQESAMLVVLSAA